MKPFHTLLTGLTLLSLAPQTVLADDKYQASAGMSYVIFKIRHFGVTNAYGRFNEFTGTIKNMADAPNAQFNFEVTAGSIDTGIAKRDDHLKGPDFFNAVEFPKITFKSRGAKAQADKEGVYELSGELTMLGVSKGVNAMFTFHGEGTHPMNKKPIVGGEAVFTIKRSDFGMEYGLPDAIGDEVTLIVSLMGEKAE